jgi:hypothetical protein
MFESNYKVPGGKLVKVKLEVRGNVIESVRILGDFFIHPEHTLIDIEKALCGTRLEAERIVQSIESVLRDNSAQMIGAGPPDFATAILLALKS